MHAVKQKVPDKLSMPVRKRGKDQPIDPSAAGLIPNGLTAPNPSNPAVS
ncbi:MAG: hypothetical protein [Olavius algarvensis Gamma 1 endosymbiont]|nr:MAG: hypothetical protein [Olavius algarvensis Gamma 1 endosymbiont]